MSRLFPCLLLVALTTSAAAATYPVDDSRSQVFGGAVRLQWHDPAPGRTDLATGELSVLARLWVAPWRGRVGRIYLVLPPQPLTTVSVRWTTRGVLLPGAVQSGQRVLVYAGEIRSDQIEDMLQLTITADGNRLVRTEQLEFRFEIDVDAP
ncbi:MAG TPA: hypothetical protein VEY50_00520 [Lysobacter sp.]|nr:hypothetical protein [Lysobacter sp.]